MQTLAIKSSLKMRKIKNTPIKRSHCIMSKLISMRQRIKAIETIKKVTHTMQLISMSTHTQLKKKQAQLTQYVQSIECTYKQILSRYLNTNYSQAEEKNPTTSILLVVIGSQKGLCGNFNSMLLSHINADPYLAANREKIACIAVGQKIINEIKTKTKLTPILTYNKLTYNTFSTITEDIIEHINNTVPVYTDILVWSNRPKTFFLQKPHATFLLSSGHTTQTTDTDSTALDPNSMPDASAYRQNPHETWGEKDYITEQPPHEIINFLKKQLCEAQLEMLLFESLLAEQASRFVSMDSATRNAKNMLDDLTLQFNKIRQAKITKELSELIGSF